MSVKDATAVVVVFGVGCFVGIVGGGWIGQIFYNKKKHYLPLLMGITTGVGTFPTLYLIDGSVTSGAIYFFALISGIIVAITGPNIR